MDALVENKHGKAGPLLAAGEQRQYLTFMLGNEMFAIGILCVREIIEYGGLSTVPMMPPSILGVINLRGAVVPVMDLSARFGRPACTVTKRTCIVIAEIGDTDLGEQQVIGMVVDVVNAVIDIADADVKPAPAFGNNMRTDFIAGMSKVNERFVIILNAAQVLTLDELGSLAGHIEHAEAVDLAVQ